MGLQERWQAAVAQQLAKDGNQMPSIDPERVIRDASVEAPPEDPAPRFRERVCVASMAAAVAIANEDPTTKGHAARAAFAREVLNNPFAKMGVLTLALSASLDLGSDHSDQEIADGLAAVWNAFAGA